MTFDQWFGVATNNIAESELPTIRTELEHHFLDSISSKLQAGCSRLEAERQAILELGDPKIAARGFARTHLTQRDWRRIHSPSLGSILFSFFFAVLWWIVWETVMPGLLPVFSNGNTLALSIFEVGNVVNIVAQVLLLLAHLQRRRIRPFQMRLGVTLLEGTLFLAALFVGTLPPFNMPIWIFWMVAALTVLVYCTSEIPLLRKLQTRV
jgi:hypothetical protein